jgi:FkbM family methyltransferase
MASLKHLLKILIKKIPIAFTKNQLYDKHTKQVMARILTANSNCIDIGCHKGEVLDVILKYAPHGHHYGFEPIPKLYAALQHKYNTYKHITISDIALSDTKGSSSFNYVISNPAYSGLQKRQYDKPNEQDTLITVQTDLLDSIIPLQHHVSLIKIDVEGGELQVLQGGINTITRCKPYIIMEHGLGGSDVYGSTPDTLWPILQQCGLSITTMANWLQGKPAFTLEQLKHQYYKKLNYYFIAYAASH